MSDFTAVQLLNQLTPVIITGGYVPRGAYAAGTDYAVGDSVDYNGSSYVMFVDAAAGTAPTDTTKWQVLANKGDTGSTGATGSTGSTGATGASITSAAFSSNDIVFTKDDTNTVTLTDAAITLKGATGATGGTGTLEDLGGATKALDNLASVAINTSLISDTDSTDDLGSTSKAWANLYVDTIKSITGNALALTPVSGQSLTVNLATTGDFVVNTNQLYVDTSTGNVGIGTTAPGYKLEVSGGTSAFNITTTDWVPLSTGTGLQIVTGSSTGNTYAQLQNYIAGSQAYGNVVINPLGGNVGIGTTGPLAKLDINSANTAVNWYGNLYIRTNDSAAIDKGGQITLGGSYSGTNDTFFAGIAGRKENATTDAAGYLQLSTSISAGGALTEKVRITSTGNVGIGTTAPLSYPGNTPVLNISGFSPALVLSETDATANNIHWMMEANGEELKFVTKGDSSASQNWLTVNRNGTAIDSVVFNQGNVGIGTTAPTNILSLGGNTARILWMERHTTANTAGNTLTVTAGGATSGATDKAGGDLILTPGLSTGTGESGVQIKGVPAGSTGTTDGTQTLMIQVLGNKFGVFANTPVVKQTGIAALKVDYTAGDLDTEAEIITALNTTNTAINALRTALNNYGFTTVV